MIVLLLFVMGFFLGWENQFQTGEVNLGVVSGAWGPIFWWVVRPRLISVQRVCRGNFEGQSGLWID
jgi:hypothetical protein